MFAIFIAFLWRQNKYIHIYIYIFIFIYVYIYTGFTAAAAATDAAIHKKMFGPGNKILMISNKEMNDIKSLEESLVLIKGNEGKEQKEGFLGMVLCTLGASFFGSLLTGNGIIRAGENF